MRNECKSIDYVCPWTSEILKARFVVDSYVNGNGTYIGLRTWNEEYQFWESYCDITVNIPYSGVNLKSTERIVECFVDTNNEPELDRWLVESGFAYYTNKHGQSGFCTYPVLRFDMRKVAEYSDHFGKVYPLTDFVVI